MNQLLLHLCLLVTLHSNCQSQSSSVGDTTYIAYHQQIARAQLAIANKQYKEALTGYEHVFNQYRFVFRRDYQAATQLALQVGQPDKAFDYLKKGILSGWTWKSIQKNKFLEPLKSYSQWKSLKKEYTLLEQEHQKNLNLEVRKVVKKMFSKDQRKALGALFRFSANGQNRYAQNRFAPHSERQLADLKQIINRHGYPGEKLIGSDTWASVILSHHNSISETYAAQDTLYPSIRPRLWNAVKSGQLSAYDFAKIDNWYVTIKSAHKDNHAGYLASTLSGQERDRANQVRQAMGLSSIETTNALLDIQQQTGMNFYLPLHVSGKIKVVE